MTLYEPEELVLSAKAGTPLAEIEALVESKGQQLAFEPMDYGPILGGPPDAGSLGGALAANLSGPRRIKAGAARDHFLGFSAVSGRAETFKSGGRVVKNVTGYDLCKLLAGSFGTLAAMTEVTIKMLPRAGDRGDRAGARASTTPRANAAMSAAMASSCDVSAAAHLPAQHGDAFRRARRGAGRDRVPARRLRAVGQAPQGRADGAAAAVRRRWSRSTRRIRASSGAACATLRRSGRRPTGDWPLWRVSTTPARGAEFAAKLPPGAQWFYDWAGGLIWIALPPSAQRRRGDDPPRRGSDRRPRHARSARPPPTRAAVDVFEPQQGALAGVTRRVKESFDPKGVLNPGRMWAGV